MNKRTVVFPIEREVIPLARFSNNLINELIITSVVPLKGWGINEIDDIGYTGNIKDVEIKDVKDNFEEKNLILCKPYRYDDFENSIKPFIEKNISKFDNVFFSWKERSNYIKDICKRENIKFHEFQYDLSDVEIDNTILYKIKKPVILVSSISEMADKFYTQMSIYEFFKKKGYRVKLVGTKSYSELLNVNSFPAFMFNNKYSSKEKIIKFNHYIKGLEQDSDVIIVGVPGGIGEYVNELSENFDDMACLISRAITPDEVVLNILYDELDYISANELKSLMYYRYGWTLSCLYMDNYILDYSLSNAHNRKEYVKIFNSTTEEKVSEVNSIENICYYQGNIECMCKELMDKLLNYGEYSVI